MFNYIYDYVELVQLYSLKILNNSIHIIYLFSYVIFQCTSGFYIYILPLFTSQIYFIYITIIKDAIAYNLFLFSIIIFHTYHGQQSVLNRLIWSTDLLVSRKYKKYFLNDMSTMTWQL